MERKIIHKEDLRRFITVEDGITGYIEYELFEGEMDLTHTIVPKAIGGRGIAADLVKFALEYAKERGLKVKPTCSYVKAYMDKQAASCS